jgi:molybdenum cofactor biosynthesis enzyme MoaA
MLAEIRQVTDIALTTNGSALAANAPKLKDAGLTRATVSLDALDDETFAAMNDVAFPVARVLAGIEAAAAAGLTPVKINMVVKRGVNHARTASVNESGRSCRPVMSGVTGYVGDLVADALELTAGELSAGVVCQVVVGA